MVWNSPMEYENVFLKNEIKSFVISTRKKIEFKTDKAVSFFWKQNDKQKVKRIIAGMSTININTRLNTAPGWLKAATFKGGIE
jgi:hypothetical protein